MTQYRVLASEGRQRYIHIHKKNLNSYRKKIEKKAEKRSTKFWWKMLKDCRGLIDVAQVVRRMVMV
jgi:hypothetical protein